MPNFYKRGSVDLAPSGPVGALPVGLYVQTYPAANATFAAVLDREFCVPFLVYDTGRLDHIGMQVMGAGDAGSVFRIGIRANDGGKPSKTVLAEGAVAADVPGGTWQGLTIDVPISPGLLWLSLVGQQWVTTAPTFHTSTGLFIPGNPGGARAVRDWPTGHGPVVAFQDNVTGTLAAHATAPVGAGGNLPLPLMSLRRSA